MLAGVGLVLSAGLALAQPAQAPGPQGRGMRGQCASGPCRRRRDNIGQQQMGRGWRGRFGGPAAASVAGPGR